MTKIGRSNLFYCILIYWAPGSDSSFMSESSDFLLSSIIRLDIRVIIVGDVNIHFYDISHSFTYDFLLITESLDLIQHISGHYV